MAHAPCKNPNCNSYGQPHPNCRCYGDMAEGGIVGPFCGGSRSHSKDCEYFSEGGIVDDDTQDLVPVPENDMPEPELDLVPVPEDDMPEMETDLVPVPEDDMPTDYTSTGQQVLTAIEGAAQGIAGPLATLAETKLLGISPEEINARQQANPGIHGVSEGSALIGSFFIPGGQGALATSVATKLPKAINMGKVGAKILGGFITNGLIQASDEVSKWMLGQGDPEDGVGARMANVGIAGLFGGTMSALGQVTSAVAKTGLKELAQKEFGQRAEYILRGIADAASGADEMLNINGVAKQGYRLGQQIFNNIGKGATGTGVLYGAQQGYEESGLSGIPYGALKGFVGAYLLRKGTGYATEKAAPALLKILASENFSGALQAYDHAVDMLRGSKLIDSGIDAIFTGAAATGQKVFDHLSTKYAAQKKRVREYVENNELGQEIDAASQQILPGFAQGGLVEDSNLAEPNGVEIHYPAQNILLNMAKARANNYLNSLRPIPGVSQLAFDYSQDDRLKEKTYDKALNIAVNPLSIMNDIQTGALDPENLKHFNVMFPELGELVRKRITERIVRAQLKEEKPNYKVRQALSLFMGVPLSTEFTPAAIQAAQAVFANKQQPQQQQQQKAPSKSDSNKLSKSDQAYMTNSQARTVRAQKP